MIAGIGLMAGLAASRFLKASSERRYEGRDAGGNSSSVGHSMSRRARSVGTRTSRSLARATARAGDRDVQAGRRDGVCGTGRSARWRVI